MGKHAWEAAGGHYGDATRRAELSKGSSKSSAGAAFATSDGIRPLQKYNAPYIDSPKQSEEREQRVVVRQKEKKSAWQKSIDTAQTASENYTIDQIYQKGGEQRKQGDTKSATECYYYAMLSGDGRSAYPLYEMLKYSEGNLDVNLEMAGISLYLGRRLRVPECQALRNIQGTPFKAADELFHICAESRRDIFDKGLKMSNELLAEIQGKAEKAVHAFDYDRVDKLKTLAANETMQQVLYHDTPYGPEEMQHDQQVDLAGDSDHHGCWDACTIL